MQRPQARNLRYHRGQQKPCSWRKASRYPEEEYGFNSHCSPNCSPQPRVNFIGTLELLQHALLPKYQHCHPTRILSSYANTVILSAAKDLVPNSTSFVPFHNRG